MADMAAGPELNFQIAEKVMGWSDPIEVRARGSQEWKTAFTRRPGVYMGDWGCYYTRDGARVYCGEPSGLHWPEHYSTTWEGMGRVVERMRELGWYVGISTWPLEGAEPCRAAFYRAAGEAVGAAEGDTAPHAVCLAALKAVGA